MPDFDIVIPDLANLRAARGRLTDWARERVYWAANRRGQTENDLRKQLGLEPVKRGDCVIPKMAGGAGSFTDFGEAALLDMAFHDAASVPASGPFSADPYMGLWTAALDDTKTGAATGECNATTSYTTYARTQIPNGSMSAAVQGQPTSKTNSVAITFPACTANSAVVTYWGVCDNAALLSGNMIIWGSCTSTTIDTSHTPPTVAIGALSVTLD